MPTSPISRVPNESRLYSREEWYASKRGNLGDKTDGYALVDTFDISTGTVAVLWIHDRINYDSRNPDRPASPEFITARRSKAGKNWEATTTDPAIAGINFVDCSDRLYGYNDRRPELQYLRSDDEGKTWHDVGLSPHGSVETSKPVFGQDGRLYVYDKLGSSFYRSRETVCCGVSGKTAPKPASDREAQIAAVQSVLELYDNNKQARKSSSYKSQGFEVAWREGTPISVDVLRTEAASIVDVSFKMDYFAERLTQMLRNIPEETGYQAVVNEASNLILIERIPKPEANPAIAPRILQEIALSTVIAIVREYITTTPKEDILRLVRQLGQIFNNDGDDGTPPKRLDEEQAPVADAGAPPPDPGDEDPEPDDKDSDDDSSDDDKETVNSNPEPRWGKIFRQRDGTRETAMQHIQRRHAHNTTEPGTSRFAPNTSEKTIQKYVEQAIRYGEKAGEGRYTYDLGQIIGRGENGDVTSKIYVYMQKDGWVRTAYPL